MCELFCLSSREPTRATFSLHAFAQRGGYPGRSIDGWGLAFHDGSDVRLSKEPEPAAQSAWLAFIEGRRVPSLLMLSHIRHATQGSVSLANTQPFVRELGGRMHVFAHNGRLDGIEARYEGQWHRFRPVGQTDSEAAFCILLDRLSVLWRNGTVPPIDERLKAVARFASEMREQGPANFLYTDGDALFAHGHRRLQADGHIKPPGLWRLQRECADDADATSQAAVVIDDAGQKQEIVMIASVPLTHEAWVPLAEGEIVVVRNGATVTPSDSATQIRLDRGTRRSVG